MVSFFQSLVFNMLAYLEFLIDHVVSGYPPIGSKHWRVLFLKEWSEAKKITYKAMCNLV